jgi:EAL domain-containing protein (putative c-di-GMP-specific phosphodiesterase class I)
MDGSLSTAKDREPIVSSLDVRDAARLGQFRPALQPVVDIRNTNSVLAAESLLRWHHPSRGVLAPAQFLDLLEGAGLLAETDLAMVEAVSADLGSLDHHLGHRLGRLWFNMSATEIFDDGFLELLASTVARCGVAAHRVGIDISEAVLVADRAGVKRRMAAVRLHGFAVAIDQFGLSSTSIDHVKELSVDMVKLDRSLVGPIEDNDTIRSFVSGVVYLVHASGSSVLALGVERQGQADILVELGCDSAQGYLFGVPGPLERMPPWSELTLPPDTWFG